MDLESVILCEVSKTDKEKYLWHSLNVESEKEMIQSNLQNRCTDLEENKLMSCQGEGIGGRES